MLWFKKFRTYLFSSGIKCADFVIIVLSLILLLFWLQYNMPISELFTTNTNIEVGYSAKQGEDGLLYVVDNGHERLICFDTDGNIKFSLDNPTDEKGNTLYIDDFALTEQGIYISASVWDEMLLSSEAILLYDYNGKYISTLTYRDYGDYYTNKHRFYGISDKDGAPRYIECLDNTIVDDNVNIAYMNAINAVGDAVFVEDKLYILDKNGKISLYGKYINGTVIYSASWDKEDKVVPYRLGVDSDGNIYFTDIRNKTVRLVDTVGKKSTIVHENTDSLTVNITINGGNLLLDTDGLHVFEGGSEATYLTLSKNTKTIVLQGLLIATLVLLGICVLILAVRLINYLIKRTYSLPQIISLWVVGAVIIVSSLLCGMLLNSFSISYREKIEEQVESAAYMVASQISGKDIEAVEKDGGFGGESYNRLCSVMENSFSMHIEFYRKLYCNILKLSDDRTDGYAIAYLDQSIGTYFPLDAIEKSELEQVYDTGSEVWNQEVEDISGTYLSIKVPVYNDMGIVCGAVAVGVETYMITDMLRELFTKILMSVVIMLMIVWLVSVEVMSFANNYDIYKKNVKSGEKNILPGHLIRLLVFLVFAAYNMTATFLPVYLLRKSDIFPDNIREFMGALPITVNIFIIGVMSLFCAGLLKRYGLRRIMTVTVMCSFAGNLLIYFTSDFYGIFIGLVLDGIGVGLITNTVYVMLTYVKDEVNRIYGLTVYNGAYLSGVNFGMMFGSFLAVMVSQRFVFLIVATTWLIMLVLTVVMMRQMEELIEVPDEQDVQEEKAGISTWRFVFNKTILSFIVLIQNPYIVFGSFIFYYVPIFCDKKGYSETICSILIMLYSEVAVLGTDKLTEWFSRVFRKYSMYIALAMNIVALVVFAFLQNMVGMIIALLIMGVSAAYGKPIQQNYFLELKQVKSYGEDKSIGIYNFSENIGESLGPVVFGRLMEAARLAYSAGVFCAVIAGMGALHYIIDRKELKYGKGKVHTSA